MPQKPTLRILSLGAGVQSTTMALMAAAGELPERIDAAIFADPQWESAATYQHLLELTARLPFPVLRVTAGNLKDGIVAKRQAHAGRVPSIPWFTVNPDGTHGMGRRQCTSEYKLKPIYREIRNLLGVSRHAYIAPQTVEEWIGITTDEADRMKHAKQKYMVTRWPLIERGMSREDCEAWLVTHGHAIPPKSACVGCPFRSQASWQEMRRDRPDEFEDACRVDAELRTGDSRGLRGVQYMHPARIPLREAVELKERHFPLNLFRFECEGRCGI